MTEPHWSTVAAATGLGVLGVGYALGASADWAFGAAVLAWVVGGWVVTPLIGGKVADN